MTPYTNVLPMGDSRTNDDTWVTTLLNGLPPVLWWKENPARTLYAVAGWGTSDLLAAIQANLSAETVKSDYVLINIGSNDLASMPVEATWKTNMLAILDAIHAWSSVARVYLTKPWRRDYGTEADTYAGWIDDVVALRPSFAYVGDDERDWFENDDDGVTYSDDGIHYNAAGQAAKVAAMRTVLGY